MEVLWLYDCSIFISLLVFYVVLCVLFWFKRQGVPTLSCCGHTGCFSLSRSGNLEDSQRWLVVSSNAAPSNWSIQLISNRLDWGWCRNWSCCLTVIACLSPCSRSKIFGLRPFWPGFLLAQMVDSLRHIHCLNSNASAQILRLGTRSIVSAVREWARGHLWLLSLCTNSEPCSASLGRVQKVRSFWYLLAEGNLWVPQLYVHRFVHWRSVTRKSIERLKSEKALGLLLVISRFPTEPRLRGALAARRLHSFIDLETSQWRSHSGLWEDC